MADTAAARRLSKSRYLAGLKCHKQLWWRVHEPDAPELVPDVALRNRFAQGAEVDQRARGYVPGGELIDLPFYEYDNKVAATRDAIRHDPPVLYQPWFLADRSEEHTSELQSLAYLVCRLLLEKKKDVHLRSLTRDTALGPAHDVPLDRSQT